MATRDTGEATRRSKKPPSMSRAKAAPAVVPPIRMPWRMAPATAKSRNPRTGGNPGSLPGAAPNDPVKIAISTSGKNRLGKSAWGVRSVLTNARRASAAVWTAASLTDATGAAAGSSAPSVSRRRPVLATNTSSRLGRASSSPAASTPASSRDAHHAGERRRPLREPQRQVPVARAGAAPRTARAPGSLARGRSARASVSSSRGSPTCAFSSAGVPSATILPPSMIPTRAASWSASSRYWVVRNTVVPDSRLSRRTSSQRVCREIGSSPVVGSSRNSTSGSCTSARARSSRRRMPPE